MKSKRLAKVITLALCLTLGNQTLLSVLPISSQARFIEANAEETPTLVSTYTDTSTKLVFECYSNNTAILVNGSNASGNLSVPSYIDNYVYRVVGIKGEAFKDNKALTGYSAGSNVTPNIPDNCFNGCSNLKTVSIYGDTITYGARAFRGCTSLQSVSAYALSSIGEGVFEDCTSLTSFSFGNTSLTSIPAYAFSNTGLESVDLSETNISSLGESAFFKCSNLKTANLCSNASTLTLDKWLLGECPLLEELSIPNSTTFLEGKTNGLLTTPIKVIDTEGGFISGISEWAGVGYKFHNVTLNSEGNKYYKYVSNGVETTALNKYFTIPEGKELIFRDMQGNRVTEIESDIELNAIIQDIPSAKLPILSDSTKCVLLGNRETYANTISNYTSDAVYYYTLDGSEPTNTSSKITAKDFTINAPDTSSRSWQQLKIKSNVGSEWSDSITINLMYEKGNVVDEPALVVQNREKLEISINNN